MNNTVPLLNRELSWLQFNERVLQEAADCRNPLIERIKFLGIYSNNLDEFFRVRVATIKRLVSLKKTSNDYLNFDPQTTLEQIYETDKRNQKIFLNVYRKLLKELHQENIFIKNEKQLNVEQGKFVKDYFQNNVRPFLFPIMLKRFKDVSSIKDTSIYLAIHMFDKKDRSVEDFAFLEIPVETISRFLILPQDADHKFIMLMDDVIRYCLEDIFSNFNYTNYSAYTFKITRDSELDLDNDTSKSFIELISESLQKRQKGAPVRLVYDKYMPDRLLKKIATLLNLHKPESLIASGRYHNFKDFMDFPNVGSKDLEFEPLPPLSHPELINQKSIFNVLNQKDILLFTPYHSFQHIVDLLREASIDPNVTSIKMTIYRVAKHSNVINALINASRNGKDVTVYMELQARFNEEQNIYWTKKLQEAGVKILSGIPGFKVHAKLIIIKRIENKIRKTYANIGTGNFNEITSKVFTDIALLTSHPLICSEVDRVFSLFETYYRPQHFKKLIVAPFSMRSFVINALNNEIHYAKKGKPAWAIIKLNNLVDIITVQKLYQASQAGVKIKLIIRGICVIKCGVPGLSENIETISILDRFLEHARAYCFCNNGKEDVYISSADWMIRNFDNRFEIACPILDPNLKEIVKKLLYINLADNQKSRILSDKYLNCYKQSNGEEPIRLQYALYDFLKSKIKE